LHLLGTVVVRPVLPDRISGLQELSRNLWWSWNPKALSLFSSLNPELWEEVGHNPVEVLARLDQQHMEKAAGNSDWLRQYDQVMSEFRDYMDAKTTRFTQTWPDHSEHVIAYFSAEFGMHESLPIYSGGLGILSGDHLKTASDLGIPMVGVGLLYNHGYFIQQINAEGWQEAGYRRLNFANVPAEKALGPDGQEVVVEVEMPDRTVHARVWLIRVGRVRLYVLDTDVEQNALEDRSLSAKLYGGDSSMRIAQEKILGLGGVRALRRLGIKPQVWHMNEGHSAFLTLELMREMVEGGLSWHEAIEALAPSICFTTHTPVPAGHDSFGPELMEPHFWNLRGRLGMSRQDFMRLGQSPDQPDSPFSLTVLALKLSRHQNGVSKLHGEVSRGLWKHVWPGLPQVEVPIRSITNGVHTGTWVAPEMADLFDRHLGQAWRSHPDDASLWQASDLPDAEVWATHQRLKEQMVQRARRSMHNRLRRLGESASRHREVDGLLSADILTLGFARRFATYKRAVLLFSDLERLKRILLNPGREVCIVFSGKAHPADRPGQEFIKKIHDFSRMPELQGHILLLEDYDMDLARHMVHGVDVWLNNPRRPLEASGTSGEKAAMNGVLNFSVLDGWWAEGFDGTNGWAIGEEREFASQDEQDQVDVNSLYATLEEEIVPMYYDRDEAGIPHAWVGRMKNSIRTLTPAYCTHRMLLDYSRDLYIPACERGQALATKDFAAARELARWRVEMDAAWRKVRLEAEIPQVLEVDRGQEMEFEVRAHLGALKPEQVRVEVFAGRLRNGEVEEPQQVELALAGSQNGVHHFRGSLKPQQTGNFGFGVRATPVHPALPDISETGLVHWAR